MDEFSSSPRKSVSLALVLLTLCLAGLAQSQETLPPDRTPPSRPPRSGRPVGDVPVTDESALAIAIQAGDIEKVTALLDKMPDRLNSTTAKTSLIAYAVRSRLADDAKRGAMLEFLLKRGANPDFSGPNFVYTPLVDAIRAEHPSDVVLLLKQGANSDLPDTDGFTPLQHAFLKGNQEIITTLLNAGVDLKRWNSRGLTPLHVAASMAEGDAAIVELMLQKGANPSTPTRAGVEEIASKRSPPGLQPLHLAAASGNLPVMRLLLKNGAALEARTDAGETPLHIAAQNANGAVQALLEAGADATKKNSRGDMPLHAALRLPASGRSANPFASPTRKEALTALIAKSDVNARGQQGLTPLLMALQAKDQVARDLLAAKGNTDPTSAIFDAAAQNDAAQLLTLIRERPYLASTVLPNGWTPLHMAALWNAPSSLNALLAAGANVNARDAQGASPLHRVMQEESASPAMRANAMLLIEKGADVNARSDYEPYASPGNGWKEHLGDTPLNRAIVLGDVELVTLILKKGTRLEARNEHRDTPLMVAVKTGKREMVPILLQAGANVDAADEVEYSPLDRALLNGQEEIAKLLVAKGADVNHRSSGNGTPLMLAARSGSLALVRLLIDNKADVNARNDQDKTALSAYGRQTSQEIQDLLKKSGATQ
jgi:ankyrin